MSHLLPVHHGLPLIVILAILEIFLMIMNSKKAIAMSIMLLFLNGGIIAGNDFKRTFVFLKSLSNILEGTSITVSGSVESSKTSEQSVRIHLCDINIDGVNIPEAQILVYTRSKVCPVPGTGITVRGEFSQFSGKRNPGETDWFTFFLRRGVMGKLYEKKGSIISNPKFDNDGIRLLGMVQNKIESSINKYTDNEVGALSIALLTGERDGLSQNLSENFNKAGAVHVLALSGLHVGFIIILLVLTARTFRISWGWDRLFIFIGLFLFVILTGFRPSVIRGSIMAFTYMIGPLWYSKIDRWNSYGLAGIVILLLNPGSIFTPGFLYSFLAVGSIFLFLPEFQKMSWYSRVMDGNNTLVRGALQLFSVSLCAQAGTTPLTLWLFHKFPLAGIFSNILIIPLIGVFVSISIILLFLSLVGLPVMILGNSLWLVYILLEMVTNKMGNMAISNFYPGVLSEMIAVFMVVNLTGWITNIFTFRKFLAVIALQIIALFYFSMTEMKTGNVIFLDVGQGDAILFSSGKTTALVDTGPVSGSWDAGSKVILPSLQYLGITKLDYLLITHDHADHTGGLSSLLSQIGIDTIFFNLSPRQSTLTRFQGISPNIQISSAYEGKTIPLNGQIKINVLYPRDIDINKYKNRNNHSLVLKSNILNGNIMISGDLELDGYENIISRNIDAGSEVHKLSHHGSINGTSVRLLERIDPKFVIISVGDRNKFNHPSESVLSMLDSLNIKCIRTDQIGAVWIKSDGNKNWIHAWN